MVRLIFMEVKKESEKNYFFIFIALKPSLNLNSYFDLIIYSLESTRDSESFL